MTPLRQGSGGQARALIKTAAVADRLNVPVDWFYKHRRRLEAHHGFPRPVAGMRHRWDPAAIDGWLDRQIPPTAVAAGRNPDYSNVLRARLPGLVRRGIADCCEI